MEKHIHMPKVVGAVQIVVKNGNTTFIPEDGNYPEGLMAYAESVIGNGLARVSATSDTSQKEFGNGVSSSVTISLSCNQDDATINNVAQTLGKWTQALARQNYDASFQEFEQMKTQKPQGAATAGPANFKP
jgi:hypothetical protein